MRSIPCVLCALLAVFQSGVIAAPNAPLARTEGNVVPLRFEVFRHASELFGWEPDFTPNVVNFTTSNAPVIRGRKVDRHSTGWIEVWVDGEWERRYFEPALRAAYPGFTEFNSGGGWLNARVVSDGNDFLYTLLKVSVEEGDRTHIYTVLLFSRDLGLSWDVHEIQTERIASIPDMEFQAGPHPLTAPPAVVNLKRRAVHDSRWGNYYNVFIHIPFLKPNGDLAFHDPIQISDRAFGHTSHSGAPSFFARWDNRLYFAWGEIVDEPAEEEGSPVKLSYINLDTMQQGEVIQIAETFPANDNHNSAGIIFDSKGFLHVMIGAHQRFFQYTRSLVAGDPMRGFEPVQETLSSEFVQRTRVHFGGQTYVAMVCDDDDVLHLVFRQQSRSPDRFNGEYRLDLMYQRKAPGQAWTEPVSMIDNHMPGFSLFFHQLARDRVGQLFLSYSYVNRTTSWLSEPVESPYHDIEPHIFKGLLFSPDGGDTWGFPVWE